MAQVDRHRATEDALGASLGAATEQLRAALEREAVEVINKARAQAASIEEAAHRRAGEIEQEAREQALRVQSDRVSELMAGVDALGERVAAMLDEWRDELHRALGETAPPRAEPPQPAEADVPTERSPELDEMMRAQILSMVQTGKSRADTERFLSRFRVGRSYTDLVDEIYSEHEQGRAPAVRGKRRRLGLRRT